MCHCQTFGKPFYSIEKRKKVGTKNNASVIKRKREREEGTLRDSKRNRKARERLRKSEIVKGGIYLQRKITLHKVKSQETNEHVHRQGKIETE